MTGLDRNTQLKRVVVFREMNRLEEALQVQLQICRSLPDAVAPHLQAATWCNLATLLCDVGRPLEAEEVLNRSQPLFQLCSRRSSVHLNRRWVCGMIAQSLGRYTEAEALFEALHEAYTSRNDPYNAGLVGLDLAAVYCARDRLEALAAIIGEVYQALRGQDLHPEAEEALRLLHCAVQRRQVTLELVRAATEQLRRYRPCRRKAG